MKNSSRAVFIDRDGVICVEKSHIHRKEDIELLPGAADSIRILNEVGYLVIVITNQPVVARGMCTIEEVREINKHLERLLQNHEAKLNGIYFCPHHPTAGTNPEYTRTCGCRKPMPGMILQAQQDFNIRNISECFMVGDKLSDIGAGLSAGCKTILVETGYGGKGGDEITVSANPDYRVRDLRAAVEEAIIKR